MKRFALALMAAGFLANTAGVAFAQDPDRIHDRKVNQQDRIAQGVAKGTLSPREAANLEHKEAGLNREIRNDRAANGGHLTGREKVQVNRQQNRLSNKIYNKKHDGPGQ